MDARRNNDFSRQLGMMRGPRVLFALTLVAILFAAGRGEDEAPPELVCEYPEKDAVYASMSDFAVSGWSNLYGQPLAIYIMDAKNVIVQNTICYVGPPAANGAWTCQVHGYRGEQLKPGKYRAQAISVAGRRLCEIPITIVSDPTGSDIPLALPSTKADSLDYDQLPLLKLTEVMLSNPDDASPKVTSENPPDIREATFDAETEFEVEGSFRTREIPAFAPSAVVLKLTTSLPAAGDKAQRTTAIVSEGLADSETTDDEHRFKYRTVLRAPNRAGQLTLSSIYRGKVLVSVPVNVRRPAIAPTDRCLTIEYPSPDAAYLPSSEIVVAGRGKLLNERLYLGLHEAPGTINSTAVISTAGDYTGGAWASRLYLQGPATRHPGKPRIIARPLHALQQSLPIEIVADPDGPQAPLAVTTAPGSPAYDDLPQIKLEGVTILNPDDEHPQVVGREKRESPELLVELAKEVAVEGVLSLKNSGETVPSDLIIRLTMILAETDGKPQIVTVNEAVTKYVGAGLQKEYPFRTVLRAPHRPGTYVMETIYRRDLIASCNLKVVGRVDK